jgi:MoxR-like ATPase
MHPLIQLPATLAIEKTATVPLPELRHWPESSHVFDPPSICAVNAALAAGRPLLLRGEPGAGKSQLARAVAQALKWPFLSRVVNGRFEPEDLLYRFDAVARLSAAQTGATSADLLPARYLLPEVLWWALNPDSARERHTIAAPQCGEVAGGFHSAEDLGFDFSPERGVVVLIDEIDKADSEVPNSLLETLSLGGFHVPYGLPYVKTQGIPPLIIITTNEDRELPPAFVRRCLVLNMDFPDEAGELKTKLKPRIRAHERGKALPEEVLDKAIDALARHRQHMRSKDLPPPGQAELLDLLRAVSRLAASGMDPLALVDQFEQFTFNKHRPR